MLSANYSVELNSSSAVSGGSSIGSGALFPHAIVMKNISKTMLIDIAAIRNDLVVFLLD
jgi:hypothetical protein